MQRLSGLDASFLYFETAEAPMHVCSVLELDTSTIPGGYCFQHLKDEFALRIKGLPTFREKVVDSFQPRPSGVGRGRRLRPRPARAPDRTATSRRPSELADICGHIASLPLDRSRPLWDTWVIEGVDGSDPSQGGRVAVLTKVHHAGIDGVSGANLMTVLCGTEPDATPPEPVDGPGGVNQLQLAATGLIRFAARPLQLAKVVPLTLASVAETARRTVTGQAMTAPFSAPKTAFNAK